MSSFEKPQVGTKDVKTANFEVNEIEERTKTKEASVDKTEKGSTRGVEWPHAYYLGQP